MSDQLASLSWSAVGLAESLSRSPELRVRLLTALNDHAHMRDFELTNHHATFGLSSGLRVDVDSAAISIGGKPDQRATAEEVLQLIVRCCTEAAAALEGANAHMGRRAPTS